MYLDCVCVLSDLTWLPLLGVGRKSWYIIFKLEYRTHTDSILTYRWTIRYIWKRWTWCKNLWKIIVPQFFFFLVVLWIVVAFQPPSRGLHCMKLFSHLKVQSMGPNQPLPLCSRIYNRARGFEPGTCDSAVCHSTN